MPSASTATSNRTKRPKQVRGQPDRTWLETALLVLTYLATFAGLVGISIIQVFRQLQGLFPDPWTFGVVVCVALMIPIGILAIYSLVRARATAGLSHEQVLRGKTEISSTEKELVSSASHSVAYIAGDFSHINEIRELLVSVYNRGVHVRVLAADSQAPLVRANLSSATAAHCEVRLYDRKARRVKALIVDSDVANAQGTVMFVRKDRRSARPDASSGQGIPGDDATFDYVGRLYDYDLLVTAVGQMFDSWWSEAQPFQP